MYAHVDMFMIQQLAIQTAESHQEHHSKKSQLIGSAQSAVSLRICSLKSKRQRSHGSSFYIVTTTPMAISGTQVE